MGDSLASLPAEFGKSLGVLLRAAVSSGHDLKLPLHQLFRFLRSSRHLRHDEDGRR